jgi:hypothetical protein
LWTVQINPSRTSPSHSENGNQFFRLSVKILAAPSLLERLKNFFTGAQPRSRRPR